MAQLTLLGRSEEIAQALITLRRTVQHGQSALVLVTGEAGIGKSAFVSSVLEQASRMGYAVGLGKAEEIGQIAPGAPLLLALRSGPHPLLDAEQFAPLPTAPSQPLWLVDRVAELLEELLARHPVVIAIDDFHWADHLTRVAIRLLTDRLIGLPVVWLIAARGSSTAIEAGLRSVRGELSAPSRIALGPLAPSAINSIAAQLLGAEPDPGLATRLEGAGGNPLIATQFIAGSVIADASADPVSLVRAVRDRLAALDPLTRSVVQLVAVWGRPMPKSDAFEIFGAEPGDAVMLSIGRAVDADLLSEHGQLLTVRHDLVREAIYTDIPTTTRAALHRRSGEHLLATGHDALTAAPHVVASARLGDLPAVAVLRRAAAQSVGPLPDTATALIRQAFELTSPQDPLWLEVGEQYADILSIVQRSGDAIELVDTLLSNTLDAETRARLQVIAARALWLAGSLAQMLDRLDVALSEPAVSDVLRTRLRAYRTLANTRVGTARTAELAAREVLADARRLTDPVAEQVAMHALGEIARNRQDHDAALTYFRTLRRAAGANYLGNEVAALRLLDRFAEADAVVTMASGAVDAEQAANVPALIEARMWRDFMLGRLEEGRAEALTLARLGRDLDVSTFELETTMVLTLTAVLRGDLAEARRRLRLAERDDRADIVVRMPRLKLIGSLLAGLDGDPRRAVRIVKPVMDLASTSNSYWPRLPEWMRVHAGLALAAGDQDFARETVARATAAAESNPGVASLAGIALQVRGLVEDDDDLLAAAVARLERSPRPMLRASALADHGRALLRRGRRQDAVPVLLRAYTTYVDLRASMPADAVEKQLSSAGAPVHRSRTAERATSGWASLTPAELRVTSLISDGHTNRTAARELDISSNTLATHLRSVFAKLDVRSRVQLANAWHAHTAHLDDSSHAIRRPGTA